MSTEAKMFADAPAPPGPCAMVIFGATGDLTQRKLLPSLCNLADRKLLPEQFAVVGFAFDKLDTDSFAKTISQGVHQMASPGFNPARWDELAKGRLFFQQGDFENPAAYQQLKQLLAEVDAKCGTAGNYLFYLATPPRFFGSIAEQLAAAGLTTETRENGKPANWRRVVIEKPFGHDLASARELNRRLARCLDESQIFRIDHYLGKETVQNLMVFRFANGIFEPIWNRRYIDHVQITVAETVGVEHRASYYDHAGALRDMVPNHIFQVLALVAMESPISFDADAVRDEKAKVLRAIRPMREDEVLIHAVRGQYGPGTVDGKKVPGYRESEGVRPDSPIETFAALRLQIESWRWEGVPFYIRTGKCLPERTTEVAVHFKRAPMTLFRQTNVDAMPTNELILHIQPQEGISLRFQVKLPGITVRTQPVEMQFRNDEVFGSYPVTGYETLLYDAMIGDGTLFQREDFVDAAWNILTPVLDVWQSLPPRSFPNYAAGTWGPKEAAELLARDGRAWRLGS